jgi:hypothetical protein
MQCANMLVTIDLLRKFKACEMKKSNLQAANLQGSILERLSEENMIQYLMRFLKWIFGVRSPCKDMQDLLSGKADKNANLDYLFRGLYKGAKK